MKQMVHLILWKFTSLKTIFILLIVFSVQPSVSAVDHEHGAEKHEHENNKNHDHEKHEGHDHKDHEEHESAEHKGHEEEELKFSTAELQEFSIKLSHAQQGVINKTLDLTGEVIVAPERLYHVVPRVSGIVRKVFKHLGDEVKAGDLLATLSSYDLADAKANFVASNSLLQLANANLKLERNLYKNKVTSKRKYLAARQTQTEMSIKRKAAHQRLLAIGLTEVAVVSILDNKVKDLALYELRAPADGVIIEQHAALGEVLETDVRTFTVADLTQVWVNLTVYQKDLPFIRQQQQVMISTRFAFNEKENSSISTISWLSPVLNKKTRSATARVVIDNPENHWRPGLFVSARVNIEDNKADVVIPLTALQTLDGQTIIFVQHDEGEFEPQVVQLGRRDHYQIEILQGLAVGQTYVSENSFVLKAHKQKGDFGHGHQH